jgi:predicted GTPase
VRHPMPYGNLRQQAVQRFQTIEDLELQNCTIEEMEEYEPHIAQGDLVFAGVDYERVLRAAEAEADVIIWDGGNNDLPFVEPDIEFVMVDPHRAGDELAYFPGFANLLRADVVLIAKVNTATVEQVETVRRNAATANPEAVILESSLDLSVDRPELIRGARVLVIEDGPTITHGGMAFGAGSLAARQFGAGELVDPRPFATGSIVDTFRAFPHIVNVLPAMGYGAAQVAELEETVRRVQCDVVVIATQVDLRRVILIDKPSCRVTYEFSEVGRARIYGLLSDIIALARSNA